MDSLYFRVIDASAGAAFDRHWTTLSPGRFVVDRSVVCSATVSRNETRCVLLRPDPDEDCWQLSNRAEGRLLVAYNGEQRYELQCDMSVWLRGRRWTGSLTDAFSFEVSTRRPAGIVLGSPETADAEVPAPTLRRGVRESRAAEYLDRHPTKRRALAHQWRQHIGHTPGVAEDLDPSVVGRALGLSAKTVGTYRTDLAEFAFRTTGHQHAIRDLVIKGRLLTWADVAEADREIARLRPDAS